MQRYINKVTNVSSSSLHSSEQFERQLDITKVIKEELKDIMMDYMMPSKFLYRDSLPLTPNGKIDIKGLMNELNRR